MRTPNIVYTTDSDEHLINIGAKSESHWDSIDEYELWEDIGTLSDCFDSMDVSFLD